MYDYAKRCSDTLLKDLQEMRKKCYSLSMEDQIEVHDEVVLGDVLQGELERPRNPKSQRKKACESRQVQSLGCLNKANSSIDINSLEEHSNVEQVSQLVDNFTQESVFFSHLVGQDYVVGQIVETN
nr:hypothetical protein CFP56_54679 [Quercus suber]